MYFKSRMFKFITITLTIVLLILGFFYVKGNLGKYDYLITQKKDFAKSVKYVRLNDGENFTNSLEVNLKVANDDIEVNYLQYTACFDNGKEYCTDWSETVYIGDKLGVQITSPDVWERQISLYKGDFTLDRLQGRHYVKVRYISRTEVMGLSIKIVDTKRAYIYVDTYAPSISSSLKYEWTTKDSIKIYYKDDQYSTSYKNSGVSSIKYSTCVSFDPNGDGTYSCNSTQNWVKKKAKDEGSFSIPATLESTLVNVIIKDKAGNIASWTQVIRKDTSKPEVKVNVDIMSDLNNAGGVTVTVSDDGSKISKVAYTFTKTKNRPSTSKFTNKLETYTNTSITLPEENGKYYLWVMAEDYAGNVTYKRTNYFYICDDDIECSAIQPNKKNYTNVLYIAIAAALVASIGILTVMTNRRKRLNSND